ncbi:uncharacterized protein [Oryctolagus cuniculus]|uniref:uncharacterized protein n=1 Tax=Oryctolagus cuniculus TaxID=9986 RepID=UPI00387A5B9D
MWGRFLVSAAATSLTRDRGRDFLKPQAIGGAAAVPTGWSRLPAPAVSTGRPGEGESWGRESHPSNHPFGEGDRGASLEEEEAVDLEGGTPSKAAKSMCLSLRRSVVCRGGETAFGIRLSGQ